MTTFVSLAADSDGAASAVAVGDWLLKIIDLYDPSEGGTAKKDYYKQFLSLFPRDESGEAAIEEPLQLVTLLLSQHELVFRWLTDIKTSFEEQQASGISPPMGEVTSADGKKSMKKTYNEAIHEVEDFFMLLMSMVILRIKDSAEQGQAAGSFCHAFRAGKTLSEFRLRLLMALYNVFPPTFPYRFPICFSCIEFAAETGLFHLFLPYVKYINEWMKDWNLNNIDKRQLYLILANELKKLGKAEEAYSYLKKHVQLFQGENPEILGESLTVSAALELAEDSIKLSEVVFFDDLLQLDAICFLKRTQHKRICSLLEIFLNGSPEDLERLVAEDPQLITTHGLKLDACMKKLRLLTVASLVVRRKEIRLKQLAELLRLTEAEAEEIVVQAIGQNIIDAKVDQVNHVVHVKSAIRREFGQEEWQEVLERLTTWGESIRSLMHSMKNSESNASQGNHNVTPIQGI